MELTAGIPGTYDFTVAEDQLAVNVGSGTVSVLATPMMIAAVEKAASESVAPYLDPDSTTVGTLINVAHTAATPKGMKVHIETKLQEVSSNGKMFTFNVAAFDETGPIGNGTHERCVVRKARFEEKARAKSTL